VRDFVAFLALCAFFVAVNAFGAGVLFGLLRLGQTAAPEWMGDPLVTYFVALGGIGVTLFLAIRGILLIERALVRSRGRARG
jgi:cellobiose-specific phosphotransferase system component IIC